MEERDIERRDAARRLRVLHRLGIGWFALSASVVLLLAAGYASFYGRLAEWQFATFDRYFPVATAFVLVAVALLPVWIGLLASKRRRRDDAPAMQRLDRRTRLLCLFAFAGAAAMAITVVVEIVVLLLQPSAVGAFRELNRSQLVGGTYEGPARLQGAVRMGAMAELDDGIPFVSFPRRFAPLYTEIGLPAPVLVEFEPTGDPTRPWRPVEQGILQRNAAPPELLRLYEYAGLSIASDAALLHRDARAMRLRHFLVAGATAILGIALGLIGLLEWRRHRRRLKQATDNAASPDGFQEGNDIAADPG